MKHSIGIIGGGLTGLTAAYRLQAAGHQVTLYEASDTIGGLAAGFDLAGHRVEQAYHFLYKTDAHILALVDELGLTDALTYHKSSVSTYYGDRLYPMETPVDLLRFNPISLIDRIRAGVTVLYLQRVKNWKKLENVTALDWLRKYAGRAVTDVIWEPLLRGKFDRYYDKVTMSWLWGRVLQRVESRDARLGGEALGYFDGGFRTVIDALLAPYLAAGGTVRYATPVSRLSHEDVTDRVRVDTGADSTLHDRVLATVPSHVLARMIETYRPNDPAYFDRLERISYLDAVVQVFATPQTFTPYYWHNINQENAPFVVFLSLTNLVGQDRFDGLNIYYIGDYVPAEHPYMSMPEADLKTRWYDALGQIFPAFDRGQIVDDALFRMPHAQHIVDIGFRETQLVDHQTPCPGVLMCNFSQIYPMDRGTNYAVRDGNRMAQMLTDSLKTRAPVPAGPRLQPAT